MIINTDDRSLYNKTMRQSTEYYEHGLKAEGDEYYGKARTFYKLAITGFSNCYILAEMYSDINRMEKARGKLNLAEERNNALKHKKSIIK